MNFILEDVKYNVDTIWIIRACFNLTLGLTKTRKHVIRDVGPIKRQGGGGRSFSKGPSLMIDIRFFGMTTSEIFKMTGILNKCYYLRSYSNVTKP